MITELRLENWKSFGEATLYIDPLTILIGTNASGKSNVLDALQFLQRIASGVKAKDAFGSIRGGLEWAAKRPNASFGFHIVTVENHVRYECDVHYSVKDYVLHEFFPLKHIGDNPGLVESQINKSLQNIFILQPVPDAMMHYTELSDRLDSNAGNIAGVLAALPAKRQKEIENTLTQYASRLPDRDIHRVYAEKVGKLGKDAMLYCDERWADSGEIFTVDARAMSDGTLRFLAILTALLTLPEGSLLAIDEVDNGLHPSRAKLLLEALQTISKQRNIDVLVTTHNPALLDAMGTEMVPFVTVAYRDPETGASKLTLLEDIEQLPKLLAQGTVGKLSTQGLIEKSLESAHG
ncbi:AAA family ATPase [Candidatus Thiothrix sp. Deng01]|uniref:AAA family ATPase n=1 Tax=Candidatus Thiothrix phosphatis TaxID=3112415 RepID=A0ABU6CYC6_9GAMM|nr:AAA family ATPase [Candidatus Thiothrix sp. Deng01]MEB4591853.1 AAA family ATPase [Candidatus Thiothrix sp. Deng01]